MNPPSVALNSSAPKTKVSVPLKPRGSNHIGMRQFNERVVLQAVRLHGPVPKAELARLTGLTAQTVGLITTRLEEDDLLVRQEPVRGRIGQPSIPLALNPDGAFSIGIKVGRRTADWLLVDFTGKVRQRKTISYAFPDAQSLLPALGKHLNALIDGLGDELSPRLVGACVAAPFMLGGWHSMLGLSDKQAKAWNAVNLRSEVQRQCPVPVSFAKDTAAACVAELVAGRGRDLKNFLYLFVDTFVGGGLVLNSQPHVGVHGNAGAVASLPLHVAGLSTHPIGKEKIDSKRIPNQLIGQASLWELEQRFAAQGLDPTAAYDERALSPSYLPETEIWVGIAANALAHCVVSGAAFLDIEAVVIDGTFCPALHQRLLEQTQQSLQNYNWEGLWQAPIYQGTIGSDARALGGALLPLHATFAPDSELFLKVTS